jgi:hypothetical protein
MRVNLLIVGQKTNENRQTNRLEDRGTTLNEDTHPPGSNFLATGNEVYPQGACA